MAQYHHLPLYRTTYNLLLELMHVTKDFSREFKFSLGEKIQGAAVDMLIGIYKANNARDKTDFIKNILELVQIVGVYVRISHDLKLISEAKYLHFTQELASVSKQAHGWLQSCVNGAEPDCAMAR